MSQKEPIRPAASKPLERAVSGGRKRIEVVINRRARLVAAYLRACEKERPSPTLRLTRREAIHLVEPAQIEETLRRVVDSGPDVVIVGGGDGTVSSAARFLYGTPMLMGILPMGTLNHFAREVGIPESLPESPPEWLNDWLNEAIESLTRSEITKVDVGEVNGRIFINNSSIGIYPRALMMRDVISAQLGLGKRAAMTYALLKLLLRYRTLDVTIESSGRHATITTPFLFVGNNPYEPKVLALSERPSLAQGILSLRYAPNVSRLEFLRIALRAFLGREDSPGLETMQATEVRVRSRRSRLLVALDGEVRKIKTPLRYRSLHKALHVLVPSR